MKTKLFFIAAIIACLCLSACAERNFSSEKSSIEELESAPDISSSSSDTDLSEPNESSSSIVLDNKQEGSTSATTSEESVDELTEEDLTNMRKYAIYFAEFFNTPFSSTDELDYQMVGFNSLFWIATSEGYNDFETDDGGYPYIPKSLLQTFVWEHFGIDDYEYPVSDNFNILPQYNSDKDAYLVGTAMGGSKSIVSILNETISGRNVTYIMKYETPNIETGEIMETYNIKYNFQIIPTTNGCVLRAISAVRL